MKRWWWYKASNMTNPWWPLVWRGGDEYGRATICFTVPGVGALIIPFGKAEKDGSTT